MRAAFLLVLSLTAGCSPAYVLQSAAGHAGLLWRRRSIERTIADPGTEPALRASLERVRDVRRFGFERLALARSSDYEHWTPVEGDALTWLVSASERLRLESKRFCFPLAGCYPYKGHFKKERALREAAGLEADGWDATVSGSAAYNTPLWIADPLPSPLLRWSEGDLAELLLHELAHGTVSFKDRTEFNEALATWVGVRGAEAYLAAEGDSGAKALAEWREGRQREARRESLLRELKERLERLYAGPAPDAEKLKERAEVFAWARAAAKERGLPPFREPLNNAVVLARQLYAPELAPFDAAFERAGRDWARTLAEFKALDRKDPLAALRRAAAQK